MYLGIDIGTSKTAAVIVNNCLELVATASEEHGADIKAAPERAEQNPSILLSSAWNTVRRLPVDLLAQVQGVGFTGQMHGVVQVDEQCRPVSPLVTWQDKRGLNDGFMAELSEKTGYTLSPGFGCSSLAWFARHGGLAPSAVAAGTIYDVATAMVCEAGRPQCDPTSAASWGLYDLRNRDWDHVAVEIAQIPPDCLPVVLPSSTIVGSVCRKAATDLFIREGIPVVVGIGDNQASLVASLRNPNSDLGLTLGTGGQISAPISMDVLLPPSGNTWEIRPYVNDLFIMVAASKCGGAAWRWLADSLRTMIGELGIGPPSENHVFRRMNELGLTATDELTVKSHFNGERFDESLDGSISRLHLSNYRLGPLARGLARSIMANLRDMVPDEAMMGREALAISGNGLRRNPLLRQMAKDVFQLPLVDRGYAEDAAVGAALNAMRGIHS